MDTVLEGKMKAYTCNFCSAVWKQDGFKCSSCGKSNNYRVVRLVNTVELPEVQIDYSRNFAFPVVPEYAPKENESVMLELTILDEIRKEEPFRGIQDVESAAV